MTSIYESRSSRGARSPPLLDPLYLTGAEDDLPPGMDALGKIVYGTDNGEKGFDGIVDGSDGGGASPEESGASVGDGEGLRDTSALRKNPRRQNSWVISAQHTSSKAVGKLKPFAWDGMTPVYILYVCSYLGPFETCLARSCGDIIQQSIYHQLYDV